MTQDASAPSLPLATDASPAHVLRRAAELLSEGCDVCIATVTACAGSAPSRPGQKLLVASDGGALGTVGGGGVEHAVVQRIQALLASARDVPEVMSFHLAHDLGMACGGRVDLLVEPMRAATPVLLVGAGHIGIALARWLSQLRFRVLLTDQRASAVHPERTAGLRGVTALLGEPDGLEDRVSKSGAVVVATHEHALDEAAVVWAMRAGYAYVGGVGSRAKAQRIRKRLDAEGLHADRTTQLRMPVGLSIGARTPEEIALSIAADLVAWRAGQRSTEPACIEPAK
ncbi:MAG: XdhC family protein [Polyangiaceae bacterium]|nr:XdhC family protein [Polyangiaceae bacterium]